VAFGLQCKIDQHDAVLLHDTDQKDDADQPDHVEPEAEAGAVLVQSNMVAILGRKLALEFRRSYPIEMRDLPFDAPKLQSVMSWHRRFDDLPAHRWLREAIVTVTAGI